LPNLKGLTATSGYLAITLDSTNIECMSITAESSIGCYKYFHHLKSTLCLFIAQLLSKGKRKAKSQCEFYHRKPVLNWNKYTRTAHVLLYLTSCLGTLFSTHLCCCSYQFSISFRYPVVCWCLLTLAKEN
jgi:hypothetical protein